MEENMTEEAQFIMPQTQEKESPPAFAEHFSMFDRFIVIDNFYRNPEAIRQLALSQETTEKSDGNYAGVMTLNTFLTQEHLDVFSKIVGHDVFPSTMFTGRFRMTKEGEVGTQDIHFDPSNSSVWAGVVYLSPDAPEVEGTVFWKHKRTGLEVIPRTQEGIEKHGWNNVDDLQKFLETEGTDYSLWNKTFSVPYKYNRLVLFRPWLFHSPGPAFGTDKETARMIQTFFWSPVGDNII